MFSPKHTIPVVAAIALSAALFSGCQSSTQKPAPAPPVVSSVTQTNKPKLVPAKPPSEPGDSGDNMASNILAWDAIEKLYHGQPGDVSAPFIFNFTNVSSGALVIYDTHTSCECTVAKLPTRPWTLASGGAGQLSASIDLSNKFGFVTNEIIVFTSQGNRRLKVEASIAK